jgi:hypothetical protein
LLGKWGNGHRQGANRGQVQPLGDCAVTVAVNMPSHDRRVKPVAQITKIDSVAVRTDQNHPLAKANANVWRNFSSNSEVSSLPAVKHVTILRFSASNPLLVDIV